MQEVTCLPELHAVPALHTLLQCSAASSCGLGQLLLTSLLLTSLLLTHADCIPGDFVVTFGLLTRAAAHAGCMLWSAGGHLSAAHPGWCRLHALGQLLVTCLLLT